MWGDDVAAVLGDLHFEQDGYTEDLVEVEVGFQAPYSVFARLRLSWPSR